MAPLLRRRLRPKCPPGRGTKLADRRRAVGVLALVAPLVIGAAVAYGAYRALMQPGPEPAAPTSEQSESETRASEAGSEAAKRERPRRKRERRPGRPANFSELAAEVSEVRGLAVRDRIRSRVVSSRALADKISDLSQEELVPADIEKDEQLLIALRLAPPDIDLLPVLDALYREQILGVYVPEESTLYVQEGPRHLSPLGSLTAAHEIAHALQDQHFDLDQMRDEAEDDADAALAVLALIEGDAVYAQQLWAQSYLSAEEINEAIAEGGTTDTAALAQTPAYIQNSLFFPYSEGVQFASEVRLERDIDSVFADPPTTTEQIMHPDRYLAGDDPQDVKVSGPGEGWESATNYEFGEFDVVELLSELGDEEAADVGQGWDGGRVRSWSGTGADDGTTAVAAALVFDSSDDAEQACDALPRWYAEVADGEQVADDVLDGDRDVFAYRCGATRVWFGLGPDAETARRLAGL